MLSDIQKEKILELAIDGGFLGKIKDKFHTKSGNTTEPKRLLKLLGFPDNLKKAQLYEVFAEFEQHRGSVFDILNEYSEQAKQEERSAMPTLQNQDSKNQLVAAIANLIPVFSLSRGKEKVILISPETHRVVQDLDPAAYLLITGQSEQELISSGRASFTIPTFDPYSLDPLSDKEHPHLGMVKYLNIYVPPEWRYLKAPPKYHGFIKKLIEHLFPIPEEREDVLDWLHHAIVKRNGTILCLAGPRGTGKSLLMTVLSELVGLEYSEMANKEILEEKFNAPFKNKRLIVFEEVEVSHNTHINKLKALANNRIALEEKGEDAVTIDNYTSMAILLNDIAQLKIEPQDRRFSVPLVAEHDLRTAIPEEEIHKFAESLAEGGAFNEIAEFGEWLLERKPRRTPMYAIKGDYYYFLCALSMSEWKTFLINYIAERGVEDEPIQVRKIGTAFKAKFGEEGGKGLRFPDRSQTFELFLKDYKHRGDYYIGKVVKEYDDNTGKELTSILPNPEFLDYVEKNKPQKEIKVKEKTGLSLSEQSDLLEQQEVDAMDAL